MKNYQLGKIYKIIDNTNNKCYIGSTCEPTLSRRLAKHCSNYRSYLRKKNNYITSFEVLKNNDYDIVLVESYPCNSKDELFARERYWTNNIDCVNKNKNQGLILELGEKEYDKQYRKNNKERIKEHHKQYRENNKERIKEHHKQYRENNKERINQYDKQYRKNNKDIMRQIDKRKYEKNIEKIKEKREQKYICVCGKCLTICKKSRHDKSIKHQNYLKSLQPKEEV